MRFYKEQYRYTRRVSLGVCGRITKVGKSSALSAALLVLPSPVLLASLHPARGHKLLNSLNFHQSTQ